MTQPRLKTTTRAQKRLLIIQTGTAPEEIRARYGDFPEWFRRAMRLKPDQLQCVRVDCGEKLPAPDHVVAAVITGSGAMVTQRLDWSENTAQWLLTAVAARLPMLGVCYGHQLLAHALGGQVDYNPRGREIGTVNINLLAAARHDELVGALPTQFQAQATHLQTVLQPPPGAVVLAQSALDDCQIVRYATQVWGMQFHPEFGVAQMRAYLRARSQTLTSEHIDVTAMQNALRACPIARAALRRFMRVVSASAR